MQRGSVIGDCQATMLPRLAVSDVSPEMSLRTSRPGGIPVIPTAQGEETEQEFTSPLRPAPHEPKNIVPDEGHPVPESFLHQTMLNLLARMSDLIEFFSEQTRRVDEYQGQSAVPISVTNVTLQSEFSLLPEIITSVLVTGPPSTAFTLKLGHRFWSVQTDARGVFQLTSLLLGLQQSDDRILSSATAGNWTLELMGTADTGTSYRYK